MHCRACKYVRYRIDFRGNCLAGEARGLPFPEKGRSIHNPCLEVAGSFMSSRSQLFSMAVCVNEPSTLQAVVDPVGSASALPRAGSSRCPSISRKKTYSQERWRAGRELSLSRLICLAARAPRQRENEPGWCMIAMASIVFVGPGRRNVGLRLSAMKRV